jgi:hypothetical protein
VDSHHKLDIANWRDPPRPIVAKARASIARAPRQLWSPTVIGLVGTLLLHSLLVPSALLGSRAHKSHPLELQEPGVFANSNADAAESLVLVTLQTIPNSTQQTIQDIPSLPALSRLKPALRVNPDPPAFLNMEVLTLGENQAAQAVGNAGDGTEQARLFGIYTGQIQARINRIWRRPRTPVNEDSSPEGLTTDQSFQCQAQIVQDVRGNVQEILLLRCNGSLPWQRSLVIAIQQASPLPAPPSTTVFSHSITLDFLGLSYAPGSSNDDYEIERAEVARTNEAPPRSPVSAAYPSQFKGLPGVTKNPDSRN